MTIKLNDIELKKVYAISLNLEKRMLVISMYHDNRMKDLTDLTALKQFPVALKKFPEPDPDLDIFEIWIPFNDSTLDIKTPDNALLTLKQQHLKDIK